MSKKWMYILIVPAFTLILVFLIIPILNSILPTFYNNGLTFKSYLDFFKDTFYMKVFYRTLKLALISTIICMILGVPTSYYISRSKASIRGTLIALVTFPLLTNSVVRSFAWITILGTNGVLNKFLQHFHLINQPLKLLYTEMAIIIGSVYLFLPVMITSLVGVMEQIEEEVLEASQSLGANRFITFMRIVFPLCVPGLIVGSVLVFTGAASAYSTPQLLGGNKNMVMATLIYQKAMTLSDWQGASLIAAIMIVASMFVIGVINKLAAKLNERGV